jgi:hypothetical protein
VIFGRVRPHRVSLAAGQALKLAKVRTPKALGKRTRDSFQFAPTHCRSVAAACRFRRSVIPEAASIGYLPSNLGHHNWHQWVERVSWSVTSIHGAAGVRQDDNPLANCWSLRRAG